MTGTGYIAAGLKAVGAPFYAGVYSFGFTGRRRPGP